MNTFSAKRFLPVAFWVLSAFEAFVTIIILLRIPPDPKHAVLAGFSRERLVMLLGSILLTIIFLGFAWACAKDNPIYRKGYQALSDRGLGWMGIIGMFAAMVSGWLLFITPPQLQGAGIERL